MIAIVTIFQLMTLHVENGIQKKPKSRQRVNDHLFFSKRVAPSDGCVATVGSTRARQIKQIVVPFFMSQSYFPHRPDCGASACLSMNCQDLRTVRLEIRRRKSLLYRGTDVKLTNRFKQHENPILFSHIRYFYE